jgi:hypothetical protein
MNVVDKVESLDLNETVPRSSKDTIAGIAHLPRMIDKARAKKNNTLGEYIYPCPLDKQILRYLGKSPESFAELAEYLDDNEMNDWARSVSRSRYQTEIHYVNGKILNRKVDPKDMNDFNTLRDAIDPNRTDVTTWDGLTDLEEGHI